MTPMFSPSPGTASRYDIILAGGGMAGLSLAYYLNQTALREKKILIIDRQPKLQNDRTWAFWESEPGPFEGILSRQWGAVQFHGTDGFSQRLDLAPYRYKLLRGLDFYRFVGENLAQNPNITFLYSAICSVKSRDEAAFVETEAGIFEAAWVFDSTFRLDAMQGFNPDFSPKPSGPARAAGQYQTLLQHFKGWVVKTPAPAFDPALPTMMDFRIDQHQECRFMYVLPQSPTEALVEFTLFTPALLPPPEYDDALRNYLRDFFQITDFQVLESEFGVIPMSDQPTTERPAARVLRIGTAGGSTRPSTGYTFARTQRRLQTIAQNLAKAFDQHPLEGENALVPGRFWFYDQVFLNVFLNKRHLPADVFTRLYAHNRPANVLRFLDEKSNFAQDLGVILASPKGPFIRAAFDVLLKKILR